jgi:predicted metalloprotease with PDZ domain
MLRTTADPDVDAALEWYGLVLDRRPGQAATQENGSPLPADFGVIWDASGARLLADQVILGHAAAEAGVLPGDELLAIDGLRVGPTDYLGRMQRLRPGQQVELTLVRHQRLMTLPVVMQEALSDRYLIVTEERISRAQRERLSAWLGRELRFVR